MNIKLPDIMHKMTITDTRVIIAGLYDVLYLISSPLRQRDKSEGIPPHDNYLA